MADDKLDPGFDEVDLDKGFEPVPLSASEKSAAKSSIGSSLREGYAQGGTFGFAPRLGAAMGAGLEKVAGPDKDKNLSDLYNEYLEYNNKLQERAKAAHPGMYYGAMLAGGIASPLNKIGAMGSAGAEASMPVKMAMSGAAGAGMGAVGGLSQSPDLTNIPEDVKNAGQGAAFGSVLGAAAPPAASALKAGAGVGSNLLESFFGPVPKTVGEGFRAGLEGSPNLAKATGQAAAQEGRKEFAKDFVNNLRTIIKSNAADKVQKIQAAAEDLPKDQVDQVLNEILEMNPEKMGSKEAEEFGQIREEILRAKEGPLKTETVRQYTDVPPPPPVPTQAQQPGPAALPQLPQMQEPMSSPAEFQGYEAVHKATVDADDKDALAAFQQKIHEKLADEKALGKNYNDNPVNIEQHPIPGTDKVRLIAKRAVTDENPDAFKEQAKQLQQMPFQDIQQDVRVGDRNIYSPPQLYKLQQLMQEYGAGASPRMSTRDMQQVSRGAAQDLSGILKENVGTGDIDKTIHAFNNIGEVLGIDPRDLQLPGGVGEKSKEDALNQVFKIINPETLSDNDLVNQEKIGYIADQLKTIDPNLADQFTQGVQKEATAKGLVKEFTKPYEPTGINPALNVIRRNMSKLAYNSAYNVGEQANKIAAEVKPAVQAGQQIFSRYSPDSLQQAASKAASSSDASMQQLGQVLSKLATSDERTRNSMIFVLEQQAGYKAMMDRLFQEEPKKDTQMKDNTLQKYK